jgi:hypothetical protein
MAKRLSGKLKHNTPQAENMNNDDASPVTVVAVATDENVDTVRKCLPDATVSVETVTLPSHINEWEFRAKFPTVEAAEDACTFLPDYTRRLDVQAKTTLDAGELQALVEHHSRALAIQEWREQINLSYGFSYRRSRLEYLADLCGERFVGEILAKARQEFDPNMQWISTPTAIDPTATQEKPSH